MNKINKIIYGVSCLIILAIFVVAGAGLTAARFSHQVIPASIGVGTTAGFLNKNVSGTINVSFEMRTPDNLSLTNVSFMWQLHSNHSRNYTTANHSFMLNSTLNNNTVNDTLWNYNLDTNTLPDGQYNLTLMAWNISNGGELYVAAHGGPLINSTFMYNITVDNTPPKVVVTTTGVTNVKSPINYTFNATVNDTLTGVQTVIFQFHNETYFNKTASKMNNPVSGTGFINISHTRWGVSVNGSSFTEANPMTVTVFGLDYAGATNSTETFTINVDRTLPTVSLLRNDAGSNSNTIKVDITTSADATTCLSNQGTVSGSGTSQTITATGLGSSISYSFEIICIDEVGNRRSVTNSFSTDALSGGGAVGSSGSSSGTATAGVVEEKTVEDAVEDVTPPAVPDAVAEPEAPATDVDEAAFEAPEVTSKEGSVVGWVVGAVVLLGLVAAYFLWSKKN